MTLLLAGVSCWRLGAAPPQIVPAAGTNRMCTWIEFENLVSESSQTNNHFCLDYTAVAGNGELDFDGEGENSRRGMLAGRHRKTMG